CPREKSTQVVGVAERAREAASAMRVRRLVPAVSARALTECACSSCATRWAAVALASGARNHGFADRSRGDLPCLSGGPDRYRGVPGRRQRGRAAEPGGASPSRAGGGGPAALRVAGVRASPRRSVAGGVPRLRRKAQGSLFIDREPASARREG